MFFIIYLYMIFNDILRYESASASAHKPYIQQTCQSLHGAWNLIRLVMTNLVLEVTVVQLQARQAAPQSLAGAAQPGLLSEQLHIA
jgi:hypothetical protein